MNYTCRLISRVVLDVLPHLYNSTNGDDTIVHIVHCLADLNHYYNVKNTLPLGKLFKFVRQLLRSPDI